MECWYAAEKMYCVSVVIIVYKDESIDELLFLITWTMHFYNIIILKQNHLKWLLHNYSHIEDIQ